MDNPLEEEREEAVEEKALESESTSPEIPIDDPNSTSRAKKSTRHQSMLQSHHQRGNRHRRHHTTSVSLSGVGVGAASCLDVYDISSLDQSDIVKRGISLWHLSPTEAKGSRGEAVGNVDGLSEEEEPARVLSSRLQSTQMAALTGQPMPVGASPGEVVTYTRVTVGPRNGALPWKPMELAKRLEIFNANEFGLCAKMVNGGIWRAISHSVGNNLKPSPRSVLLPMSANL